MAKKKAAEGAAAEAVATEDDFAALLQKEFKPKSDRAKEEVQSAVQSLAEQVLQGEVLMADDVVGTISAIIAEIDLKLTEQVNQIMDVDQWMRSYAIVILCGVGDTYTKGNNHNHLMYLRPSDNKFVMFPWDMDFSFKISRQRKLIHQTY